MANADAAAAASQPPVLQSIVSRPPTDDDVRQHIDLICSELARRHEESDELLADANRWRLLCEDTSAHNDALLVQISLVIDRTNDENSAIEELQLRKEHLQDEIDKKKGELDGKVQELLAVRRALQHDSYASRLREEQATLQRRRIDELHHHCAELSEVLAEVDELGESMLNVSDVVVNPSTDDGPSPKQQNTTTAGAAHRLRSPQSQMVVEQQSGGVEQTPVSPPPPPATAVTYVGARTEAQAATTVVRGTTIRQKQQTVTPSGGHHGLFGGGRSKPKAAAGGVGYSRSARVVRVELN